MVSNQVVAEECGEAFVGEQDGLLRRPPSGARPLHAVHVDDVGDSFGALEQVEDPGVVPKRQAHVVELRRMANRGKVEGGRAPPPRSMLWNVDTLDASPCVLGDGTVAVRLAVDDDAPPSVDEKEADLLGRSLKAAVGCG